MKVHLSCNDGPLFREFVSQSLLLFGTTLNAQSTAVNKTENVCASIESYHSKEEEPSKHETKNVTHC